MSKPFKISSLSQTAPPEEEASSELQRQMSLRFHRLLVPLLEEAIDRDGDTSFCQAAQLDLLAQSRPLYRGRPLSLAQALVQALAWHSSRMVSLMRRDTAASLTPELAQLLDDLAHSRIANLPERPFYRDPELSPEVLEALSRQKDQQPSKSHEAVSAAGIVLASTDSVEARHNLH